MAALIPSKDNVVREILGDILTLFSFILPTAEEISLRNHRPNNDRILRNTRWSMRKTLLLVFIHGFKGGDDTFGGFPEHLRALLSHALPSINVLATTYPKFETRGELNECVERFREWLQNKVIDLEVAASTPSPTVDPSVHTILVGHSMGGIVAAETLLLLANDHSVSSSSTSRTPGNTAAKSTEDLSNANAENAYAGVSHDQTGSETSLLFPYVKGILAFDTPFLGISPGLIAHGAEDQYRTMSSAYKTLSGVSSAFGWQGRGTNKSPSTPTISTARGKDKRPAGVLPPAESQIDAAAVPKWQSWGKYAMYAGAAGAIAAGGAAALYSQKDKINFGWNWVSDHLVFVGSLLRAEELKQRIKKVGKVASSNSIGLANCYTALGKAALEAPETSKNSSEEVKRTFARLPPGKVEEGQVEVDADGFRWMMAKNNKARDEISAHVSMFYPKDNPGYYNLGQTAKALILQWIDGKWYEESQDPADVRSDGKKPTVVAEDKWKQHDWEDEFSGQKEREKSSGPQEGWEDGTGGDGDDVRMRDELTTGNEVEDLESSVLVDKAL